MRPNTKVYLIMTFFFVILISYLCITLLYPNSPICRMPLISKNIPVNCIVFVLGALLLSFALTELIDFFTKSYIKMKWRTSKLGEILISEGYVTEEELTEALSEQSLRLGETLLRANKLTEEQLKKALDLQRESRKKLGEILTELGIVSDEDVVWALNNMDKPLGEILTKKGYLVDHELNASLELQRKGPEWVKKPW